MSNRKQKLQAVLKLKVDHNDADMLGWWGHGTEGLLLLKQLVFKHVSIFRKVFFRVYCYQVAICFSLPDV